MAKTVHWLFCSWLEDFAWPATLYILNSLEKIMKEMFPSMMIMPNPLFYPLNWLKRFSVFLMNSIYHFKLLHSELAPGFFCTWKIYRLRFSVLTGKTVRQEGKLPEKNTQTLVRCQAGSTLRALTVPAQPILCVVYVCQRLCQNMALSLPMVGKML